MPSDADTIDVDELVVDDSGGASWSGGLTDLGPDVALHWRFDLCFAEVDRSYGSEAPVLSVDWVPLPGVRSWRQMAGRAAQCRSFADPIECSLSFFDDHRFEQADLRILDQQGGRLLVAVEVRGDIDRCGVTQVQATQWLAFEGLWVNIAGVVHPSEMADRLRRVTDLDGLAWDGSHSRFAPR